MTRLLLALLLVACASAQAQQLYRWIDEKGRVNITDTPPPPNAKSVHKPKPAATATVPGEAGQVPFELAAAMKDFPVSLYTSPNCKELCASARTVLNRRGIPFTEVLVWNEETNEQLKKVSGSNEVPTLVVGRSVQRGYEQTMYDALLDSARYPKAGVLAPRAQAAPAVPEGYAPAAPPPKAEPVQPEPVAEEEPKGPYAPGAPPQRATRPVQKK